MHFITDYAGLPNWPVMVATLAILCGVGLAYKIVKTAYLHSIRHNSTDDDLSETKDFIINGKVGEMSEREKRDALFTFV